MKLTVASSPHIRGDFKTSRLMLDVVIALLPALLAGTVVFGFRALALTAVSMIAAVAAEGLYALVTRQRSTVQDCSALVTGMLVALILPIAVLALGSLISSPIFNARRYAGIIEVKESDFATDLPETSEVTNIALMDTDSAMILGNRTLGSLSHVVSQYTVSSAYTQINYKNTPKKVTNLEYDGFFKWIGNRENGIPGMVVVDPVNSSAEYVELAEPMHYVESGYFGDDLLRKLRFMYPTKIFDTVNFGGRRCFFVENLFTCKNLNWCRFSFSWIMFSFD